MFAMTMSNLASAASASTPTNVACTAFCRPFAVLDVTACGSMSTPVTGCAPSFAAAIARIPDPQP